MTRSSLRRLSACGLALACLAGPASAQAPLRYKFKQGDVIPYAVEYKTRALVNNSTVTAQFSYDTVWTVTAVDAEGKAKISQKIGRVRMSANAPVGQLNFDSKEGKDASAGAGQMAGSFAPFLNAFVGSEIALTVDAHGAVSDLTLPPKIVEGLREMRGGVGTGEAFALGGFKRLIAQPVQPLPPGPAVKGQTWEQTDEFRMRAGNMKIEVKYTYEGPETRKDKPVERIAVKPTISIGKGRLEARATIKSQTSKGWFLLDPAAGRLVEFSLTQDVEQEVPFGEGADTQKAHTSLTIKLLDKGK